MLYSKPGIQYMLNSKPSFQKGEKAGMFAWINIDLKACVLTKKNYYRDSSWTIQCFYSYAVHSLFNIRERYEYYILCSGRLPCFKENHFKKRSFQINVHGIWSFRIYYPLKMKSKNWETSTLLFKKMISNCRKWLKKAWKCNRAKGLLKNVDRSIIGTISVLGTVFFSIFQSIYLLIIG